MRVFRFRVSEGPETGNKYVTLINRYELSDYMRSRQEAEEIQTAGRYRALNVQRKERRGTELIKKL